MRSVSLRFDTSNDVAEECRVRSGLNDTTATSERWGWAALLRCGWGGKVKVQPLLTALDRKTISGAPDRPPIVVPPTVLVQRPPEAWGEGR